MARAPRGPNARAPRSDGAHRRRDVRRRRLLGRGAAFKREGYDVLGLFMKNWEDDDDDEHCSTREDLIDAAAVAETLEIELEAVNFAAEYKDRVFASFLAEYAAGRNAQPGRALQRRDQVQSLPRSRARDGRRRRSRPATTPACAGRRTAIRAPERAPTRRRIRATSSTASTRRSSPGSAFRSHG